MRSTIPVFPASKCDYIVPEKRIKEIKELESIKKERRNCCEL